MSYLIKTLSIIFLFALISCNNDEASEPKVDGLENSNSIENMIGLGSDSTMPNTESALPGAENSVKMSNVINPEHGQPGHVCELPVGQLIPENMLPKNNGEQPNTTNIQTSTDPTPATKPGMNPAHGQPGHRCDIAVGEPLSDAGPASTPATITPAPATTVSNQPNVSYPVVSSPLQYSADHFSDTTKVAAGMNPAHGQPGHRCDISVGEPLNKKVDN
jgi:hypothetical protein